LLIAISVSYKYPQRLDVRVYVSKCGIKPAKQQQHARAFKRALPMTNISGLPDRRADCAYGRVWPLTSICLIFESQRFIGDYLY